MNAREAMPSGTQTHTSRPCVQFKRVLVPLDFSNCSDVALQYAIEFARQHESQLILLHVMELTVYPNVDAFTNQDAISLPKIQNMAETMLKEWKNKRVPPDVKADIKMYHGQAYLGITDAARELGVDLIIISTHGFTGWKHLSLGSTTERVVRFSHCAVLTVKIQTTPR